MNEKEKKCIQKWPYFGITESNANFCIFGRNMLIFAYYRRTTTFLANPDYNLPNFIKTDYNLHDFIKILIIFPQIGSKFL